MGNYKELIVWQKSVDLITDYLNPEEFEKLNEKSSEISKMLNALISKLQTEPKS